MYEDCIKAISNISNNFKFNLKLLISVGLGVMTAIVLGSKIIAFLLVKYNIYILFLFLGLILGGLPVVINKISLKSFDYKNLIFILVSAFILLLFNFGGTGIIVSQNNNILIYFVIGLIDATTMVIPGISGTAILIILDLYSISLNLFSSLTNINNIILNLSNIIPYLLGLVIAMYLVSLIMNFLFKNFNDEIYSAILVFQSGGILMLLFNLLNNNIYLNNLIPSIILFNLGMYLSYSLKNKNI